MAIGLLSDGLADEAPCVLLPGHMFPLPLANGRTQTKESRSGTFNTDSPWASPHPNPLDIGPLQHIFIEAIECFEDGFPDPADLVAVGSPRCCSPPHRSPASPNFPDNFVDGCLGKGSLNNVSQPEIPTQPMAQSPSKRQKTVTGTSKSPDLSRSPSSASCRNTPPAAPGVNTDGSPPSAVATAERDTRRGENVRHNPKMQQTARNGQKHWHDKVHEMRTQYELARTEAVDPHFEQQRLTCRARNLKCQKESLLIFFQFATQQRLITPLPFVDPANEAAGFLGWTGFYIQPGMGTCFRAGVESLFPDLPKINTLYHLFRRAGVVPEDWRRAWDGQVPFLWNPAHASKI